MGDFASRPQRKRLNTESERSESASADRLLRPRREESPKRVKLETEMLEDDVSTSLRVQGLQMRETCERFKDQLKVFLSPFKSGATATIKHIKTQYFNSIPATFLQGGHTLPDDDDFEVDSSRWVLVVPQVSVLNVVGLTDGEDLSFRLQAPVDCTLSDAKFKILQKQNFLAPKEQFLLYDVCGRLLTNDDPSFKVNSVSLFQPSCCMLVGIAEISGHRQADGGVSGLQALSKRWTAVELEGQVAKRHYDSVCAALWPHLAIDSDDSDGDSVPGPCQLHLPVADYRTLRQRFPALCNFEVGSSVILTTVEQRFFSLQTHEFNSFSSLVAAAARDLRSTLLSRHLKIEDSAGSLLDNVMQTATVLANKSPRKRNHKEYAEQVLKGHKALDFHQRIVVGKMVSYRESGNLDEELYALEKTRKEMMSSDKVFIALLDEFNQIKQWSDSTEYDHNATAREDFFLNAGQLVDEAKGQKMMAEQHVKLIADVQKQSESQRDLIKLQIRDCNRVVNACQNQLGQQKKTLFQKLRPLLKQAAEIEALEGLLEQRKKELKGLETTQEQLYVEFEQEGQSIMQQAKARLVQATQVASAADTFCQSVVAGLQRANEEMDAFRRHSKEHLVDVAADVAAAHAVVHGAHAMEMVNKENKLKGAEEAKNEATLQVRKSLLLQRTADAKKHKDTEATENESIERLQAELKALRTAAESFDAQAEPAWRLLEHETLGGPAAPGAECLRVRTSADNRAAWTAAAPLSGRSEEDRVLERPQVWVRAMKEDVRRYTVQLLGGPA